jgi:hypothetical protein
MEGEVKSMRSLPSIVCAVVVVAACGRVPGGTANGDFKLYEAVSDRSQIAVIDSQSHSIERWLPLGTPSPDWKHLYSVAGSSLTDTDPQTGAVRFSLRLPGSYQLPPATLSGLPGGMSQDGRRLVLESFDRTPNGQPTASHFLVVSTSLDTPPISVDMTGFFAFDTISNDGDRLYLIQYLSATNYTVRMYHLSIQQLDPQVIFDKTDPKDSMTGERLSGIPARDGGYLYSIYVRQNDAPFIHALTLDGSPIAFCIDLPGSGYQASSSSFNWSLAMTADGSRLYAANGATGMVSEVDVGSSLSVARSVKFDSGKSVAGVLAQDVSAKELGTGAAVVSPDGKTLVTTSSSGIAFIDTGSLQASAHALTNWTVWSLALSPDGKVLYALGDSGKIAEISMAGRQVAATFDPGAGNPLTLMRVEAAY